MCFEGGTAMKCGYCVREMLRGYIPTPAIEWIPAYGKSKMRYTGEKEEGFRLGKQHFLDMKKQPAWYCPACDVITIDCKCTE